MATTSHFRRTAALAAVLIGLSWAADASAYGWPVKPFHQQHPVRGFFGDPRIGHTHHGLLRSFHFGIDVSAPNGTPVYATLTGRVELRRGHGDVVAVRAGRRTFEYWHIAPAVTDGQRVVAYRTVIGRVLAPWAHVHFSEFREGVPLNPLRAGALRPFVDATPPTVHLISVERDGRAPASRGRASGRFDLVAEVYDTTPVAVPAPWDGKPVMPAVVRWRLRSPRSASAWRTAADFRRTIPTGAAFDDVYARWTRQNKASRRGRYRVILARAWDSSRLPDGLYRIEVAVADLAGNRAAASRALAIRNGR